MAMRNDASTINACTLSSDGAPSLSPQASELADVGHAEEAGQVEGALDDDDVGDEQGDVDRDELEVGSRGRVVGCARGGQRDLCRGREDTLR
jgi:hypothetical protein